MHGKNPAILGLLLLVLAIPVRGGEVTHLRSLDWEDEALVLRFDGPYESRAFTMADPHRLVLDFPGVRTGLGASRFPGQGRINAVRVGQHEASNKGTMRCRVVLDMSQALGYKPEEGDRSLRILFAGSGSQRAQAPVPRSRTKPTPVAKATASTAPVRPVPKVEAAASATAPSEEKVLKMQAQGPSVPARVDREAPPLRTKPAPAAAPSKGSPRGNNEKRQVPRALMSAQSSGSADLSGTPFAPVADRAKAAPSAPKPAATQAAPVTRETSEAPQKANVKPTAPVPAQNATPTRAEAPALVKATSAAAPTAPQRVANAAPSASPSTSAQVPSARPAPAQPTKTKAEAGPASSARPMQVAAATRVTRSAGATRPAPKTAQAPVAVHAKAVKPDGAPINLELRGAEFKTLLRAFSEFSGMNIISGADVRGKVSVQLKSVPWRQALVATCEAHGYGVVEEDGIMRVAPRTALVQEEMEALTAEKKRSEYRPLETRIVNLRYAVADELTDPLSKMLSERGKVDVDGRTNSLLITDLREYVDQVSKLAEELDMIMPQVEITARIVDIDYYASRDLGVSWSALNMISSSTDLAGSAIVNGNFPSPAGDFKVGTIKDWGELNVRIQALEEENKADIISNPRVLTMDNREASILVGKKIPLIVADEAGNAVTQLTTVGIKLYVTPHINPEGKIQMMLHTEVSDLSSEATVQGGVIISTSESTNEIMVGDGETAVIAGLIKSSDSKLSTGLPWIGRVPVIGRLFGYENKARNKRELVIFITPRIVRDSDLNTEDVPSAFHQEYPFGS